MKNVDIDDFVQEKVKQYELDHTFKVKIKNGNTYVFCNTYDYITQRSEEKLRNLFYLMNVKYSIKVEILGRFYFRIEGEDVVRAKLIQRFINNGYVLKW